MSPQADRLKLKIGNQEIDVSTAEIPFLIRTLQEAQSTDHLQTNNHQNDRALLPIDDLNWTPEEIAEAYARLQSFQEDWNAPGMEAYDDL